MSVRFFYRSSLQQRDVEVEEYRLNCVASNCNARTLDCCWPPVQQLQQKSKKKIGRVAFHMKSNHFALSGASRSIIASQGEIMAVHLFLTLAHAVRVLCSLFAQFHQDILFVFYTTLNLSTVGYTYSAPGLHHQILFKDFSANIRAKFLLRVTHCLHPEQWSKKCWKALSSHLLPFTPQCT